MYSNPGGTPSSGNKAAGHRGLLAGSSGGDGLNDTTAAADADVDGSAAGAAVDDAAWEAAINAPASLIIQPALADHLSSVSDSEKYRCGTRRFNVHGVRDAWGPHFLRPIPVYGNCGLVHLVHHIAACCPIHTFRGITRPILLRFLLPMQPCNLNLLLMLDPCQQQAFVLRSRRRGDGTVGFGHGPTDRGGRYTGWAWRRPHAVILRVGLLLPEDCPSWGPPETNTHG